MSETIAITGKSVKLFKGHYTSGRVVATDVDTRFLDSLCSEALDVRAHNIISDALPEAAFDLVHTQWVLLHIAKRDQVLDRLIAALKPGGWLLLEESHAYGAVDPESVQGRGFAEFIGALEAGGFSASWGRRLPEVFSMRGLADVSAEAEVMIYRRGAPLAEFWRVSHQQIRDRLAADGRDAPAIDELLPVFADPGTWFQGPVTMAAWGKRW
ncbi:MAG: class I SAM-dependent methyltransferase [Gammaproteobacteria bacterium]